MTTLTLFLEIVLLCCNKHGTLSNFMFNVILLSKLKNMAPENKKIFLYSLTVVM